MKMNHVFTMGSVAFGLLLTAQAAMAEQHVQAQTTTTVGAGTPAGALPPPQSSNDPKPPVAAPALTTTGITEQAGVGGTQAYGRAGVLELGGSARFSHATDFTLLSFNPTFGYFFIDNVELSAIIDLTYTKQTIANVSGSTTVFGALAEPSFHMPFNDSTWGFLGVGVGVQHSDAGTGLALAPRLGANFLVGRSGLLTPALFANYYSTDTSPVPGGGQAVAVNVVYGLQIGYSVMW